jgi:hypothetical protein
VEAGAKQSVHHLLEGLARLSCFGPELGHDIVVES